MGSKDSKNTVTACLIIFSWHLPEQCDKHEKKIVVTTGNGTKTCDEHVMCDVPDYSDSSGCIIK